MNKIFHSILITILFAINSQAQNPCEALIQNGELVEGAIATYFLCPEEEVLLSDDSLNDFMSNMFSDWLNNCSPCEQYIYTNKVDIINYAADNSNNQNSTSEIINVPTEIYVTQLKNFAMGQFCNLYTIAFEQKELQTESNLSEICLGETVNLTAIPIGFSNNVEYSWTFNDIAIEGNEDELIQEINQTGTFAVTVEDIESNCSMTASNFSIDILPQPLFSFQNNNQIVESLSLCSNENIQVELVFEDGTNCNNCTIEWKLDDSNLPNVSLDNVINEAGEYEVTVSNTAGCTQTNILSVIENGAPNVNIQFNNQNISNLSICMGSSATIAAEVDLNDNCTFQWFENNTVLNGETNAELTVNDSGEYSVEVTSSNGCTNTGSISVSINSLPEVTINIDESGYCEGMPNSIDFTANTSDVTFTWLVLDDNADQIMSGDNLTTIDLQNLSSGIYSVSVEDIVDSEGCEAETITADFEVLALPNIQILTNTTDANENTANIFDMCAGNEVVLSVPNFNVLFWGDGSSNATFTANADDNYSVLAQDENGCTNTAEINVNILPIPDLTVSIPDNQDFTLCTNESLEIIAVLEGNNMNPSFIWLDGIPSSTTNTVTVSSSTEQTINGSLLAINDFGCQAALSLPTIQIYNAPIINSVNVNNPSSCNENGSIEVNVVDNSEGDLNLIYTINGEEFANGNIPNIPVGQNYTVDVGYQNQGCTVTSNAFNISAPGALTAELSNIQIGYCVEDTLILSIENVDEIIQSTITWSFSDDEILDITDTYSVSIPLVNSLNNIVDIDLTYTDINDCANAFNQSFEVYQLPNPTLTISNEAICIGESVNISVEEYFSNFLWSTNDSAQNIEDTPNETTEYIVTVTDENGCINKDSISVEVTPLPTPVVLEQVYPNTTALCTSSKAIYLFEPNAGVDYSWSISGENNEMYFHDFNTEQNFVIVEWNSNGALNLFQEVEGMCSVESEMTVQISGSGIDGAIQRFGNSSTLIFTHPDENQDLGSLTYQWYYVESTGELNMLIVQSKVEFTV